MTATDDVLLAMRAVLASERDAIRRLDASALTAATLAKETLIARIVGAPDDERAPLLHALSQVRDELKRNLVLLAHARDCVRDTMARARPAGAATGSRISVRL